MTSISGSMSPADRIQQMLQSAVTSGTVKSADQSTLSSAISDIGTSLQSGTTSLKPAEMKTKVDSLVDQEVTDGKLTSDQATELKQVFAQAGQAAGHHHGGHHHVKASDDSSAVTDITSTGSSSSTTSASSTSSTTDSLTSSIQDLMGFLKKLESATSSATSYTAGGTSAGGTAQNLLANLFA